LSVSRKGHYDDLGLPGGKIDPGETPEQALIREVKEETDIDVIRCVPVFEDADRVEGGVCKPCRTYLVTSWTGVHRAREDAAVAFVSKERLQQDTNTFNAYNKKLFAQDDVVLKMLIVEANLLDKCCVSFKRCLPARERQLLTQHFMSCFGISDTKISL